MIQSLHPSFLTSHPAAWQRFVGKSANQKAQLHLRREHPTSVNQKVLYALDSGMDSDESPVRRGAEMCLTYGLATATMGLHHLPAF